MDLLILFTAIVIICTPLAIGGYIVDKLIPEDEEVLEYEKQVQERKRAKAQARSIHA